MKPELPCCLIYGLLAKLGWGAKICTLGISYGSAKLCHEYP